MGPKLLNLILGKNVEFLQLKKKFEEKQKTREIAMKTTLGYPHMLEGKTYLKSISQDIIHLRWDQIPQKPMLNLLVM